jgi:phosphate-selective porin OprO/OprP
LIDHYRNAVWLKGIMVTLPLTFALMFSQSVAGQDDGNSEESAGVDTGTTELQPVEPPEPARRKIKPGTYIISPLLVDKTIPVLGGRWGGDVFVDAPLNGEPSDAAVTLRRARLKYSRGFLNNWQLKLSADYAKDAGLELNDTYFMYKGWKTILLTIGVDDPPFSLESVSSATGLTFMERSLAVQSLSERKAGGITILKRTANSIINADIVFFAPKRDDLQDVGQALVLHYVHSPISFRHRDNIHLGGSVSYRINANPDNTQFRSHPEIAVTDKYFVDTGTIDGADKVIRTSLEASRVSGRLSWQSELLSTRVERNGLPGVRFWGAYAYVSWFLSNDSRNYLEGYGKFDAITPGNPLFKGGRGAFELAFRASYVDLSDKDVIGGKESNLSLGFNWYLNYNLRLMINVIKVLDVKRPGSEYDGMNPLIFALRAQWLID